VNCRGVPPPEHNSASIERLTRSQARGKEVSGALGGVPFRHLDARIRFEEREPVPTEPDSPPALDGVSFTLPKATAALGGHERGGQEPIR